MNRFTKLLTYMLDFPKSVWFNFHYLPLKQAVKLPIWISHNVKISSAKGKVSIADDSVSRSITIGVFEGSFCTSSKRGWLNLTKDSVVVFKGTANIAKGGMVEVNGGKLTFGDNFFANANFLCSCSTSIDFGDNALIGWNVTVIDGDGHSIINRSTRQRVNFPKPIAIGRDVWLSANVTVLKGSEIAKGCVAGTGSIVSGKILTENALIVGQPARVVRENIEWNV